jgi:hypothetical protein
VSHISNRSFDPKSSSKTQIGVAAIEPEGALNMINPARFPSRRGGGIFLLLTLFFLAPLEAALAAKAFPPVGMHGDGSFRDRCPAGQYLVGLRVRSGGWVDQMSITCAPVNPDGSIGQQFHGPARGGDGGGPSEKTCAAGHIIHGMGLQMTAGNRQVREFVFYCRSTTGNSRGSLSIGNGAGTFPSINQNCPDGEAAVGIQGNLGKHVNAAGLLCGRSPKIAVANAPSTPQSPPQNGGTSLGEKIAAYAEAQHDKCVADGQGTIRPTACPAVAYGPGECTHLVQSAVKAAGAKGPIFDPRPYDWGRKIPLSAAQRGDIIQLEATQFTKPGGGGTWGTSDKHTAIIVAKNGDMITLIEQNANNLRAVKKHVYDFSWPHTGEVIVYRAESGERSLSRPWQNHPRWGSRYGQGSSGR